MLEQSKNWKWGSYSHIFVDFEGGLACAQVTAMAASLLLGQGWAGVLKIVFLEAGAFRGVVPIVSLSAESGKNEKRLPTNPKKQSPPKSHRPCWAIWHHHLQESQASWLQHIHLLRTKPGPLEVQDASALFRKRVTSPLRAQFKD